MLINKVKLKKYLCISLVILIFFLIIGLLINWYEYKNYTKNFNQKIAELVAEVKKEYPNVSEDEIIKILNSTEGNNSMLEKYGIYINEKSIVKKNDEIFQKFFKIEVIFILLASGSFIVAFMIYNSNKDKELKKITKYIEEINRKNYTLHIDENTEDELSILRNEIYKTTVMLKESADNSLNDKRELKKSLEDISHQLKTPLTSILVMLDNLIDDQDMDKRTREDFIIDIKREVVNINFLVQAILKLSNFDANTIELVKENNFIKKIMDESIRNVSTLCDLRNIKIEVSGDEKIKINCDYRWQIEAITNIIKNCIDHSEENSKIIVKYEQNNVYTLISIRDFGDGICKEDLPHIFERFYKGKNANKDSIGIGLALSKVIIEADNGNIDVESEYGKGTIFTIKYFM